MLWYGTGLSRTPRQGAHRVICLRQSDDTRQHFDVSEGHCNTEIGNTPGVHIWRKDEVIKRIPAGWLPEQKQYLRNLLEAKHMGELVFTRNMWRRLINSLVSVSFKKDQLARWRKSLLL